MTSMAMGTLTVEVCGESMVLLPHRAVYWPARRALIVADVHVGKSETYRHLGVPVPDGVMRESLERLRQAAELTLATRLIVLGDLVHHARGLTEPVISGVANWRHTMNLDVILVRGNHERGVKMLPPEWSIEDAGDRMDDGPFVFRHEPSGHCGNYVWCGHLHPTVRVQRSRVPCFRIGLQQAILPAFSAFTGGRGDVIAEMEQVFAIAEGQVVEL